MGLIVFMFCDILTFWVIVNKCQYQLFTKYDNLRRTVLQTSDGLNQPLSRILFQRVYILIKIRRRPR